MSAAAAAAGSLIISASLGSSVSSSKSTNNFSLPTIHRNSARLAVSTSLQNRSSNVASGLSFRSQGLALNFNEQIHRPFDPSNGPIEASDENPPIMPAVMTSGGPLDLSSVLFRNRVIFVGQPINSQVAQRVMSQLVTLATIDEEADILMYINCPGGSIYSILAIYDTMSWIKPKVGTVCFGVVASHGTLLLAGGEKGMRYAMPNARIMIHQPQTGCGGHVEDVRRQVDEAVQTRHIMLFTESHSYHSIFIWSDRNCIPLSRRF
ncbi:hypothetical protein AQUCO_00700174v1 [Aquilegia coerulea]|uniref:ATP-dependent Clp protease proteolytic subunit n=1 Tax=Aquilegia coerulea TaxID=218851 RepID=A0A2G5EIT2_AQUCA|nr:hypothetical protein AQUCO_00700174v1 [Aquilegia coerulea]